MWDAKAFPFVSAFFWGMRKSVPSTVIVQSLIMVCVPNRGGTKKCDFVIVQSLSTSCAPDLLSKSICVCGGGSGGGGEDQMLGKKTYA